MILSICDSAEVLKTMKIVKTVINAIRIIVPIILIITSMITFVKAIPTGDNKKAVQAFTKKVVAAVVILLVPTIVGIIFKLVDQNRVYYSCIENATKEGINGAYVKIANDYLNIAATSLNEYDYQKAVIAIKDVDDPTQQNALINKASKIKNIYELKKEIEALALDYDPNKAKELYNKVNSVSDSNIRSQLLKMLESAGVGRPLSVAAGMHLKTYNGTKYYEVIPDGATTKMPLIIYLVGGNPHSSFANPEGAIKKSQPTKTVLAGTAYKYQKFIYIYPDYSADNTGSFKKIKEVIDHVVKEYEIDEEHIILTGVSNGAVATFWLAYNNPKYFSAVVPMCGPAYGYTVLSNEIDSKAKAMVGTPLWTLTAGRGDFGNYEYKSKQLIQRIHKISPSSKALYACKADEFKRVLTSELGRSPASVPSIGTYQHCTIMAYYGVPEFWEWMLKQ